MFKIKIQSVFVIALLFFTSCVSTNISSKGKTPSWVTETEHEYTKNNLCAVGIASSQDQANSIAISNIGKTYVYCRWLRYCLEISEWNRLSGRYIYDGFVL
mgnify:CR=1 FL=1